MVLEGVDIRQDGPQSGLVWLDFSQWQFHGTIGTKQYWDFMKKKAFRVNQTISNELTLGTKHYNKSGTYLKNLKEILDSYAREGGIYVDLDARRRKMKLDPLVKKYGVEGKGHDGSAPDRTGPGL